MSRIGKQPVIIPPGVTVRLKDSSVTMKGPRGEITREFHPAISISLENGKIHVSRNADDRQSRSLHGLTRSLLQNMVEGVTKGYEKKLQIVGLGYRASKMGKGLQILIGYSHAVNIDAVPGIDFDVEVDKGVTRITVRGVDKGLVGQVAANLRAIKEPEPYRGKGIIYIGETIRRKAGKAGKTGGK